MGRILVVLTAVVLLVAPPPSEAGHLSVDELIKRIFTDPNPVPYEATADFDGTLTVVARGQRLAARAAGSFREWRAVPGGLRRRTVDITTLDLPLLLRPFSGNLKRLIQERIEREEGTLEILPHYDMFIVAETSGGRIILGGIRRDIVTEVLTRYGRAGDAKDDATRRAIAKWLYLPGQREMIIRPGGPYLVTVLTDEEGLLYSLITEYDWGPVETKIEWAVTHGHALWREVKMDSSTDLTGIGRLDATLVLRFSNHCYNCRR
ncbi:MAG: hypothetical protein ACRDF5_12540 [bacterium]